MNRERGLSIVDTRGTRMFCAARQNPFEKFTRWPLLVLVATADDRRASWKPITRTHPVYNPPWKHQDKRVLCYDPPIRAIDTIQISCTEYSWRCAVVSHARTADRMEFSICAKVLIACTRRRERSTR